jgi:hypothetical protein
MLLQALEPLLDGSQLIDIDLLGGTADVVGHHTVTSRSI